MTPSFMNSLPSPFHVDPNEDHDHHHQFFAPNYQLASSSSYSYQFYFNSTQDQTGYYSSQVYQPPQQLEVENNAPYDGLYEVGNKVENGLKLSLGNKEGKASKMRLMHKMKKCDDEKAMELPNNKTNMKHPSPSSLETEYSSNSSSNNSNTQIRVCSDCNTTKTPLWRSGPKGPKSLCNACGIRQRKARRAMAAAAAAAAANATTETQTAVKIKVNNKDKIKNNITQTVPFKKRCCKGNIVNSGTTSISQEPKKLGFEDFLINLSNKLAYHHVFPQDEKEAAILLMAISCGVVHG